MAEKDKIQRTLESYNDVFADIVNVLLFNGADIVKENDLSDAQPFSYYKMDGNKVHSQERDVSKYWNNGQIRLSMVGLENQMKIDKFMPLRVIGYDGAAYRAQLLEKPRKACYPIITLVLYFGTIGRWKQNRTLKEVIPVPSVLDPFVSDYKINVFELAWLTDKQINCFKSDFRSVVQFLKCQRTKKEFTGDKKKLKHGMEILDLLRVMSNNDANLIKAIEGLKEKIRHFYDLHALSNDQECRTYLNSDFVSDLNELWKHDQAVFDTPEGWQGHDIEDAPLLKNFPQLWKELSTHYSNELSQLAYRPIPLPEEIEESISKILNIVQIH